MTISINNNEFSVEEFPPASDTYENHVLTFISEWNAGTEFFSMPTSGSTGQAKVLTVNRRQMQASAHATLQHLGIESGTPVTVCIDVRYIGGKMQLVRALMHSLALQIYTPSANLYHHLSQLESLGLISLVPMQLYELLKTDLSILNKADAVLIGGGPVSDHVIPHLSKVTAPVYHTYGMTETLSHIALKRLNGVQPDDVFIALPGIELAVDNRGCLVINGAVTDHEPVVTNDVVELKTPGSFVWKGRYDDLVNSGGVKIFPETIDKQIAAIMASNFAGCNYFSFGVPDSRLGQKLVLFVETPVEDFDKAALMESMKQSLPRFHAPGDILLIKKFFKTASGKLDKRKTAFSVL